MLCNFSTDINGDKLQQQKERCQECDLCDDDVSKKL